MDWSTQVVVYVIFYLVQILFRTTFKRSITSDIRSSTLKEEKSIRLQSRSMIQDSTMLKHQVNFNQSKESTLPKSIALRGSELGVTETAITIRSSPHKLHPLIKTRELAKEDTTNNSKGEGPTITNTKPKLPPKTIKPVTLRGNSLMSDAFPDELSVFEGLETSSVNTLQARESNSTGHLSVTGGPERSVSLYNTLGEDGEVALRRLRETITAKVMPPQELDNFRASFNRQSDERVRFTLRNGKKRIPEVYEHNPVPDIAIYYVPGADLPQVNQLEEMELSGRTPEQKDSFWRAHTAATFLQDLVVNTDLTLEEIDKTSEIVAKMKARANQHSDYFVNKAFTQVQIESQSQVQSIGQQFKQLTVLGKSNQDVTIDSDKVKIVSGNEDPLQFDVHSTAIEVDGSSLMRLMVTYRAMISNNGGSILLSAEEIIELLETMIEDARRLFVRSPALARMSTRLRIIKSVDTRYGFDDGTMFRTWTTSKGIAQMISGGASYYNSLQSFGEEVQAQIRPKFLQMIVLLLSFLNRKDLHELKKFLELTYKFNADPVNMEIAFLKVLPLVSLAPSVFLEGAISAFESVKWPLVNPTDHVLKAAWENLIRNITNRGYLVPAGKSYLGLDEMSWIPEWQNFKNSDIFNNIQSIERTDALNDIPPLSNHNSIPNSDKISAVFTNGRTYIATAQDIPKITFMIRGTYFITDTTSGEGTDFIIEEEVLNQDVFAAVTGINEVIIIVNSHFSRPSGRSFGFGRSSRDEIWYNDVKSSGKLTKLQGHLLNDVIAVTYKQENKKITKEDLIRCIDTDLREVQGVVLSLEARLRDYRNRARIGDDAKKKIQFLNDKLNVIKRHVANAYEKRKSLVNSSATLSDEPMRRVLYSNIDTSRPSGLWMNYQVQLRDRTCLEVESVRLTVSDTTWDRVGHCTIRFRSNGDGPQAARVVPLEAVQKKNLDKELHEGDQMIIVGRILYLLEEDEDNKHVAVNCFLLLDLEKAETATRRRRRGNHDGVMVITALA